MKIPDDSLREWVKQNPPAWSDEIILEWNDYYSENELTSSNSFVTKEIRTLSDIDLRNVIGQKGHYAGQTWREALFIPTYKPSKLDINLFRLSDNPTYYSNCFSGEDIYFSTVDNTNWFTDGGGNHRTIIAKFLYSKLASDTGEYPMLKNVRTKSYTVDWSTYNIYKELLVCIKKNGQRINIRTDKSSSELKQSESVIITSELFFVIDDHRFTGINTNSIFDRLNSRDFNRYATWVIEARGKLSWLDKSKYWFQFFFGKQDRLIYPGSIFYKS